MANSVYYAHREDDAKRKKAIYEAMGCKVKIEAGLVPKRGSGKRSSPNYGKTEMGYVIIVDNQKMLDSIRQ